MARFFNETRWDAAISNPDWYVRLYPELQALRDGWEAQPDDPTMREAQYEVRDFFDEALRTGRVALAETGQNLDIQRQATDAVVIHHTSAPPGYPLSRMNSDQMLRTYVPYFMHPTVQGEEGLRGQPLWSNHVRSGRPVFYLYHWLMRMDGTAERLLHDSEIGWHAANWEINCRSVGICLDNNYELEDPTHSIVQRLGRFIVEHYSQVPQDRIFGHGEVSSTQTICPGANFVDGWKQELLAAVETARRSTL